MKEFDNMSVRRTPKRRKSATPRRSRFRIRIRMNLRIDIALLLILLMGSPFAASLQQSWS
jgi:hypothetical protein